MRVIDDFWFIIRHVRTQGGSARLAEERVDRRPGANENPQPGSDGGTMSAGHMSESTQ